MIEPSDITIEYLANILDDAAIDYEIEEDKHIYVTSTEFNMWIKRNPEKEMIVFTTYWKLREDVNEVNALRLARPLTIKSSRLKVCLLLVRHAIRIGKIANGIVCLEARF